LLPRVALRMDHFDVAIVGGGPAGLSAALVLGRCRRRVIVFDHGHGRNYAAVELHGYLGHDCIPPSQLRELGRREGRNYGVEYVDAEVNRVCFCGAQADLYELECAGRPPVRARKLLLATGVRDELPNIENFRDFYGRTAHHCPYCDGWEHRDQRLVAVGEGKAAIGLALSLRTWSDKVAACIAREAVSDEDRQRAERNGVTIREGVPVRMEGRDGRLERLCFENGPPLECDALFFNTAPKQRSRLPLMLGCECDEGGMIRTQRKQGAGVCGLFLAGDADGDVQFAIVAAAEGAIAATAINRELQDEDRGDAKPPEKADLPEGICVKD
jgi:thioredoxin reductase